MSTKKRRIATYIPTEIEDKFQAFKQEREVGDSQALILILTEFLGVSQEVTYSNESLEKIKSELLSELKSELVKEAEKLETELNKKIGELKSELLSKPLPKAKPKTGDQRRSDALPTEEKGLNGVELGLRLSHDRSYVRKTAKKFTRDEFASWSKGKDPENVAWELREDKKYYPLANIVE
jgi:hypothetical protein